MEFEIGNENITFWKDQIRKLGKLGVSKNSDNGRKKTRFRVFAIQAEKCHKSIVSRTTSASQLKTKGQR